jgi:peptide/nickel transport system substrate-binding protein
MAVVAALALSTMRPDSALADVRVRQALNYAVDRDAIARVVLRGVVAPNGQGVVAGVFGYDPAIAPYPYDPAKARALLREAGRDRGLHLKASVIAKGAVEGEAIYQRVAQDLAQVGVTLDVRNVFGSDWVQMWVSGDWRGADMVSAVWNGATFLDAIRAVEPFACARPGAFFCDAEVDRLIAASNGTFDAKVREGQLKRVLARLHDLAPSIYLFPQPELIGVAPRVRDVTYRGRYVDWGRITVAP